MRDESVRAAHVIVLNARKTTKPLRVRAQVVICERADIIGFQKQLQELLRRRLNDMLAIDREVYCDVELVRIRATAG